MADIDVRDDDIYGKYAALAGTAVANFGGEFLARGCETGVREGTARSRNVIIKWPDMDTAKAFYNSPEYQEALKYGLPAADREYLFVEGA
jgi:uncharacterized protein (DUF1330 family)